MNLPDHLRHVQAHSHRQGNLDLQTFEAEEKREREITPVPFDEQDTRFCVNGPVRILMRDGQLINGEVKAT